MVFPMSSNTDEGELLERKVSIPTAEEENEVASDKQVFAESANDQQLMETVEFESDEEEDVICPICLLEIVEGEDLVECVKRCHIQLHRHCMEICKDTIMSLVCNLYVTMVTKCMATKRATKLTAHSIDN